MADNFPQTAGSGRNVATDQVTHSGDTADVQLVRFVLVTGSEGSKTVIDLPGDATNGLDVDVTRLPALPAGSNNIGDVDVLTLPALPAGTNNIGDVDILSVPADPFGANADAASATGSLSAKLRFIAATGIPVTSLPALPAGANAIGKLAANSGVDIGDVDVTSLPSLPAGTNNIGDVDVLSLPALAAGTNRIGSVRPVDSSDADLTSAKGTQTSRAVGTQDLKDAGRTELRYYAVAAAAGTTGTETAITLTKSSGTAATSTGTSHTPTNGKRFRITSIIFATRGHATATIQTTTFNLRVNTGGAVTTSSTPVVLSVRSATPATASAWDRVTIDLGEGWEIVGDGTLQFGVTAAATYTTNAPTWDCCIIGYEF